MVLLARAGRPIERFYEYLQGPAAQSMFRQFGFASPG
jgi:hypothetical protein